MGLAIQIKPEIIKWAIDRSGISYEKVLAALPQIEKWINQTKKPSIKQLEKLAKKLHIPFGFLLLEKAFDEKFDIPYFRTFSKRKKISLEVKDMVNLFLNRQNWLSEYLKEEGYEKLPFVGKFKNNKEIEQVVKDIRSALEISEDWARKYKRWEYASKHLTKKIEDIGITICFSSIVENNTHRKIPLEECRGFVLTDKYAPFMFINSADTKSAQHFTLIHELAHIWIGESAGFDFRNMLPADDFNEKFCDKVAAEFLVPENIFRQIWKGIEKIEELSKQFKVSPIVIARRALDLNKISKNIFFEFYNKYIQNEYHKNKNKTSGGDSIINQKKRLGERFLSFVNMAVKQGKLLYRDACYLTNSKPETFQKIIQPREL